MEKTLYYWEREPGRLYTLAELEREADEAGFYWDFSDILTESIAAGELHIITGGKDMNRNIIDELREEIEKRTGRGAWDRGVTEYALELADNLAELSRDELRDRDTAARALLNGAESWNEYSSGGCSLIYDYDIARRLCCPSELRRTRDGEREPNRCETWLDVQARALKQAAGRVMKARRAVFDREEAR